MIDDVGLWDSTLDLLLGARCPGCGRPGRGVCAECVVAVRAGVVWNCPRAAAPGVRIWAAGSYDPVPRRLLTAFKERRRRSLGTMLGRRLGAAVAALVVDTRAAGPLVLAPVPSRRAAARSRPYDAVGILAEVAAESLVAAGVPTRTVHVLHHRRDVADQAGLSRSSRERNLAGALAGTRVDGALVVVVDDIVTTGATVAESVRALCAVGCAVLGAAAVAATVKRT